MTLNYRFSVITRLSVYDCSLNNLSKIVFKSGSETKPSEGHLLPLLGHLLSGTTIPDELTKGLHQFQWGYKNKLKTKSFE